MVGSHGTGKTQRIKEAWENLGVKGKIFSGATLDPWLDFIGVPRPVEGEDGNTYLDYVLPEYMADDSIEAIFVDELNRSHKQVKNALFELIQFKSINGKRFPNLKVVWAAINPSDDDDFNYDVEDMDDALEDRFHVIYKIAPTPDRVYFERKFGEDGKKICNWWSKLGKQVKNKVSPRRLEYILDGYYKGVSIDDMVPHKGANTSQLITALRESEKVDKLRRFVDSGDGDAIRRFLEPIENFTEVEEVLKNDGQLLYYCFDFLPDEQKTNLMSQRNILNFAQIRSYIRPELTDLVYDWQEAHNYYMNIFLGEKDAFDDYWRALKQKISLSSHKTTTLNRSKATDANYWDKFPNDRHLPLDDITFLLNLDWSFINKKESETNTKGLQKKMGGVISELGGFKMADVIFRSLQEELGEISMAWLYPDFIRFVDKFMGNIDCFKISAELPPAKKPNKKGPIQASTPVNPPATTTPATQQQAPNVRSIGGMVANPIEK